MKEDRMKEDLQAMHQRVSLLALCPTHYQKT